MKAPKHLPLYWQDIRHFKPAEFDRRAHGEGPIIEWAEFLSPELMRCLDDLRHNWGHPITISAADGTVGRNLPAQESSDHYCNMSARPPRFVRAVDVMPYVPTLDHDMSIKRALGPNLAVRFFTEAVAAGFGAIGLYPYWRPHPGFHLGLPRPDNERLALWGYAEPNKFDVNDNRREYTDIYTAIAQWPGDLA